MWHAGDDAANAAAVQARLNWRPHSQVLDLFEPDMAALTGQEAQPKAAAFDKDALKKLAEQVGPISDFQNSNICQVILPWPQDATSFWFKSSKENQIDANRHIGK